MKRAALYSGILHFVLLLLVIFGLPSYTHRPLEEQKPMMIEFVNISDLTQAPLLAHQDVQEPDLTEEPPQPNPVPEPEPAKPEPLPEPILPEPTPPEPAPAPTPPEPAPSEPEVQEEPEPLFIPEPIKIEKPKPEKKPEPKPEPKKIEPKKDDKKKDKEKKPEKIELNLDPNKKKEQKKKEDADKKKKEEKEFFGFLDDMIEDNKAAKKPSKSSGKTKGAPADKVGDDIMGSEVSLIVQQIAKKWNVPQGVRGAKNLVIKLHLKISRDKVILSATISEKEKLSDPTYRAAAEAAQRAALDPNVNLSGLDSKNYNPPNCDGWHEVIVNFDPKDM